MSLHQTAAPCTHCGAPVIVQGQSQCLSCATADESEDTSEEPTVIAPSGGLFTALNTDESIERSIPKSIPPRSALAAQRDTLDLETPGPLIPAWALPAFAGLALSLAAIAAAVLYM